MNIAAWSNSTKRWAEAGNSNVVGQYLVDSLSKLGRDQKECQQNRGKKKRDQFGSRIGKIGFPSPDKSQPAFAESSACNRLAFAWRSLRNRTAKDVFREKDGQSALMRWNGTFSPVRFNRKIFRTTLICAIRQHELGLPIGTAGVTTEGERDTKNFIRVPSPSTAFVKVRSASLGIRFLITRHSPTKILQTGLLGAPERNPTGTRRVRRSQSVLSGPVSEANNAKYWHISRVSQLSKDDFLCNPDCVAEREGFEPPVRF